MTFFRKVKKKGEKPHNKNDCFFNGTPLNTYFKSTQESSQYLKTCNAHHPVIASIDLGTNSCRLLIAKVNVAGLRKTFFRRRLNLTGWKIIDSFSKIVRLGEGLHKFNALLPESIDRTMEALDICRKKLEQHHVTYVRSVATEACRRATNSHILVNRARDELGLNIEIISTEEEARLALTGCAAVLNPQIPYAVVFDIGGGSTEVIWLKINDQVRQKPGYPVPFDVIDSISIPYGVVTISESYAQFASTPEIHNDVRNHIRTELKEFIEKNTINTFAEKGQIQFIGSSGTVTTLAAVQMGLSKYERRLVDGVHIQTKDLHAISQEILNMSQENRSMHPCIGGGRADLVVVGAAILEGICDAIHTDEMCVADRGVREGILSELLMKVYKNNG